MTFTYPSELLVLRAQLELEGIDVIVKDELTALVNPMYSNAMGGIKLQVRESDVPKAIEILVRNGYLKKEEEESSQGISKLEKFISKLPLPKTRLGEVIWVAVIVMILTVVTYFVYLR